MRRASKANVFMIRSFTTEIYICSDQLVQLRKAIGSCKIFERDFGNKTATACIPKVGREGIRTLIDSLSNNLSAGERIAALPPYQFLNELIIVQFKAFRSYSFRESIEFLIFKIRIMP